MKLLKLVSVLACILASGFAFAAAPGKIAVTAVSGNFVSVAADGTQKPFEEGDFFAEKTRIATGADSSAKIALGNGTVIALGPNTVVDVPAFIQNNPDAVEGLDFASFKEEPDATAGSRTTIELVKGKATFKVAKLLTSSNLKVKTRTGTVSVKGTTFAIADDGNSVTTTVVDGAVSVAPNGHGAVTISAGRAVTVPTSGSPSYRGVSSTEAAAVTAAVGGEAEAAPAGATASAGEEIVPAVGIAAETPESSGFDPATGYSVSDPNLEDRLFIEGTATPEEEEEEEESESGGGTNDNVSDSNSPASVGS